MDELYCLKKLRNFVISKQDMNEAIRLYKNGEDISEIMGCFLKNLSTDAISFKSACFKKYIVDENMYINFFENPDIDEENNVFECYRCKSKKVFSVSKQVRRGDEATTVFAKCFNCNNTWTEN